MAATLTADGELTFFSFPIEKSEETADGDLIVYGKATDGTVDSDLQIVDPEWSSKAIEEWLNTGGNLRVQHQARRDPAGRGLSVEKDPSGDGSWVKALVVEPVAKNLVKKGVLTSYSVGISHPDIRPDPSGKAMNGIISGRRDGLTKISELSLVDRGSNFNSKFQLVKAAGDGHPEFVGKMLSLGEDLEKIETTISVKPSDLAKFLDSKHLVEKRDFDPNVGGGIDRDQLPAEDFAGPNRTYPIHTPKDAHDAWMLSGQADDKAAVQAKIKAIAQRKGPDFVAALPDTAKGTEPGVTKGDKPSCSTCGDTGKIMEGHRDCPDCDKSKPKAGSAAKTVENDYQPKPYDANGEGAGEPVTCPKCGKGDAADAKFCDQCGFKLAGADGVKVKVNKKAKAVCQGCGKSVSAKHAFCPECGKKTGSSQDLKKAVRAALKGAGMSSDDSDGKKPPAEQPDVKGTNETDDESPDNGDDSKPGKPNPADSGDDGDDGDGDDGDKAVNKPAVKKRKKGKVKVAKANGDTVTAAARAKNVPPADSLPPHREPDGAVVASFEGDADMPSDTTGDAAKAVNPELAVSMRYKTVGVDADLGRLHDLLCPCYDPQETSKCFPHFDLNQLDVDAWQQKAFNLAASAPLPQAQAATKLWQNAVTLQQTSANDLWELRHEAHKAFADANPGPGSFPTPTKMSAQRYNRPYLSAGHAAASPGQMGPNTAPIIGNDISAEDYTRGFLSSGQAADSPANKATGAPSRVFYSNDLKNNARQAMSAMHDHISQTFPDICPMFTGNPNDGSAPAAANPVPASVGAQKANGGGNKGGNSGNVAKRLEKAVLKGFLTLEEAKSLYAASTAEKSTEPEVTKAATLDVDAVSDLVTKAVTDAVSARQAEHEQELADLRRLIKKQAKTIDKIASEPEPGGPFKGVALNLRRSVTDDVVQKSAAEQARDNVAKLLYQEMRNSPDPSQREVAWAELQKMMFNGK